MIEAFITGSVLEWARKRSYKTIDDAAQKLNIQAEKLNAWEKGQARPTFRQAQELARKLRVPFGYLYLSKPPVERLPLPDLRTKSGVRPQKPSPDFLEVIYDALRKQEWYHDYLANEGVDQRPFVGRFKADSPIGDIAADIRKTLRLDDRLRRENYGDEFLNQLVRHSEEAGVLVMRNSVVGNNTHRHLDPNEFQGFAISDALAPLVFVNQNDFLSAQVFTLIHELAHIWMGVSGITALEFLNKPEDQTHNVERATDAVAAEVLVPRDTFNLKWEDPYDFDTRLADLSRYYRVSRFVILRRAYELGKVTYEEFHAKHDELRKNVQKQKRRGGQYYGSIFSRNSHTVTTTILFSMLEGRTSPKEGAVLLNIRAANLPRLEKYLAEKIRA